MFRAIRYRNFRLLRDATLPLGPFTLIVGPNASGKSSALAALTGYANPIRPTEPNVSVGLGPDGPSEFSFEYEYESPDGRFIAQVTHRDDRIVNTHWMMPPGEPGKIPPDVKQEMHRRLDSARVFSLDSNALAQPSSLTPEAELGPLGNDLANVVDRLRDEAPERFEHLNADVGRWLPEFDRVLFETPGTGQRSLALRRRIDGLKIPAMFLSQGTLLAIALLTLSHLPDPPAVIGLEEPGRGIHPRLLREVRDALYRLAYPGPEEDRDPVQVIVTTHSPYMLDLVRDHPEEVVIAQRDREEAHFERLGDRDDLAELTEGVHLGDLWYSGVLGGIPTEA